MSTLQYLVAMSVYMVLYVLLLIGGISVGGVRYRRLTAGNRWFWWLLLVTLLTEVVAELSAIRFGTNMLVYRLFAFVQYALIVRAYQQELPEYARVMNLTILAVVAVGIVDGVQNVSMLHQQYHTLLKTITNVLIILWSMLSLRKFLSVETYQSFTAYPLFWLSVGWLSFSVLMLFNFSALNFVHQQLAEIQWLMQLVRITANYVLYGLFVLAFSIRQYSLTAM